MNYLFVLAISSLLCFFSFCQKENTYQSRGEITGRDYRKCACFGEKCGCCGDYVIKINDTAYLFREFPSSPKLDLGDNTKFPLFVSLDWKPDSDSCAKSWRYIDIERWQID